MNDDELPDIQISYDDLPPATPIFEELAAKVRAQAPGTDPMSQLPGVLQKISMSCKEKVVRHSLIKSYEHPNGIVAIIVKQKLKSTLPPLLQHPDTIAAILSVLGAAAKDDRLWSAIYPTIK
jgi:hypothetical protein